MRDNEDYIGMDRRNPPAHTPGELSIVFTGKRLPLAIIMGSFVTLITAIIYVTVWLTKLDDRVLNNAIHVAENRSVSTKNTQLIAQVQNNVKTTSVILERVEKRLILHEQQTRKVAE